MKGDIQQAYADYRAAAKVAREAADGDSNDAEIEALQSALYEADIVIGLYRQLTGDEDE